MIHPGIETLYHGDQVPQLESSDHLLKPWRMQNEIVFSKYSLISSRGGWPLARLIEDRISERFGRDRPHSVIPNQDPLDGTYRLEFFWK